MEIAATPGMADRNSNAAPQFVEQLAPSGAGDIAKGAGYRVAFELMVGAVLALGRPKSGDYPYHDLHN